MEDPRHLANYALCTGKRWPTFRKIIVLLSSWTVRVGAVECGTALQARRSRVRLL